MNTVVTKIRIPSYEDGIDYELPFIGIVHRAGRMPIAGTAITQYGEIELLGADGQIEVLGSREVPCKLALLQRLRSHHEGLLLVEFPDKGAVLPAGQTPPHIAEQLISARLLAKPLQALQAE